MGRLSELIQLDANGDVARDENGNVLRPDNSSGVSRFAGATANALVAGFGDEALDLFGATQAAEDLRRNEDRLAEENPVANFGAQALGFLAPASAIGKAVGIGAKGVGVAGNIGRSALAGGIEGAAAGAGFADGQTALERVDDAALGGAIGLGAGGVLSGLGQGARRLLTSRRTRAQRRAAEDAAETLGVDADTIVTRLGEGESIQQIALQAAGGNETAALNNITKLTQRDNGRIARQLGVSAENRQAQVSQGLGSTARGLTDDLSAAGRTSVDEINPLDNAERLSNARDDIGEAIGAARANTDVNVNAGAIVGEITEHPSFGAAASKQLNTIVNQIGELQSSAQIMRDGEVVGQFVVLSAKQAEEAGFSGAGIFARMPKETGDGSEFVPADLDANVFGTLVQTLRTKGSGLLDNTAEDASNTTAVGAKLVDASDEVTNILTRNVPELAELDARFIANDGEQRLIGMVNGLFGNKSAANNISSLRTFRQMVAGNKDDVPNIDEATILRALRAGLSEQLADPKVLDFDTNTSQYRFLREAFKAANADDEFTELTKQITARNQVIDSIDELTKSTERSTDPVEIGRVLAKVFETPAMQRSLDALPADQQTVYREAMSEAIDELKLLKRMTGLATTPIVDKPTLLQASADHIPFVATVFNTMSKILTVTGIRALRDTGVIQRGSRRYGIDAEQMTNLLSGDQSVLNEALVREFQNSLESGYRGGLVERAIRTAAIRSSQTGEDDTSQNTQPETFNTGPANFNQTNQGSPFGGGGSPPTSSPINFGSTNSGSPFN